MQILSSFDLNSLRIELEERLDLKLDEFAAPGSDVERVVALLKYADHHGLLDKLFHALIDARPKNLEFQSKMQAILERQSEAAQVPVLPNGVATESESTSPSTTEQVITVYPARDQPAVPAPPLTDIKAKLDRADSLMKLGLREKALVAYDDLIKGFGNETQGAAMFELHASALFNKATTLSLLERGQEAIAAFDGFLANFGHAKELSVRERVVDALSEKANWLDRLDRLNESIDTYNILFQFLDNAPEMPLRIALAKAYEAKILTLARRKHNELAIAVCNKMLERLGSTPEVEVQQYLGMALVNKARLLGMAREREAVDVCNDAMDRYKDSPDLTLRVIFAKALLQRATLTGSEEDCVELIARFGKAPESRLREVAHSADRLLTRWRQAIPFDEPRIHDY